MPLNKNKLEETLYGGIFRVLLKRTEASTSGDDDFSPESVIKEVATELSKAITEAVNDYVTSADVKVGSTNIAVVSSAPGALGVVQSLKPAKLT